MPKSTRSPTPWIISSYFAQGFPYTVVRSLSTAFFTDIQMKEAMLGLTNLLGVPWNLKFIWAPLLDIYGTKRKWQLVVQSLLAVCLCVLSGVCLLGPAALSMPWLIAAFWLLFVLMGFLAATDDIAIDALYIEALPERAAQAQYSGYRVLAYRLAMVYGRSGFLGLVSFLSAEGLGYDYYQAWGAAFAGCGGSMALLALLHLRLLPRQDSEGKQLLPEAKRSAAQVLAHFGTSFRAYLKQENALLILLFLVAYKMGDELLFSMVTSFFKRELGVSNGQFSWLSGIVGAAATIMGALYGGRWIHRVGLRKAIWPITFIMNGAIPLYIYLAYVKPVASEPSGMALIALIHFLEQFAAGLGTSALLVFLLGTCVAEFKAAHYAIGSAIMSIPGNIIGSYAGFFVQDYGYLALYWVAFVLSLPSLVLVRMVPIRSER